MDSEQFSGVVTFGAAQGELDYYVMAGPDPAQVAETYAELTGFAPLPPKWTLGYQQSGFGYRTEAQLLTTAQTFRSSQIPCDALYFDLFYENKLQIFTYDPVAFPTPQAMNQTLDQSGFKRIAIFDSALNTADPLYPSLSSNGFFLGDGTGHSLVATTFVGRRASLISARAGFAIGTNLGSGRSFKAASTQFGTIWMSLGQTSSPMLCMALTGSHAQTFKPQPLRLRASLRKL